MKSHWHSGWKGSPGRLQEILEGVHFLMESDMPDDLSSGFAPVPCEKELSISLGLEFTLGPPVKGQEQFHFNNL